ncbi:MAG TPA: SagB/ThcOx family dehydrogenase [Fibrobacteria bacterium]|nr:SagB/ThcOx family dehydrogenase [Fibrobacteria bacterium]
MASFTERYHELTKYNPNTIDKLGPVHWDSQPPPFKAIRAQEKIELLPALKAVMARMQEDDPSDADRPPSGLEPLAGLLFFTLGITARLGGQGQGDLFLRAAPSAGGLYPTEIYVAARNQAQAGPTGGGRPALPDGIYHYHSLKSALIPVWQGSFWADLKHYFLGDPAVDSSDLLLLFTGIYGRSAWRYKERAYRRILLDTGHAVGNLLESCRRDGLDYALLGGFLDEGLEELLFLTPKEEFPLLGVALGPRGRLVHAGGQIPGDAPAEAARRAAPADPMQVQQNSCERIRDPARARPRVQGDCGAAPFEPRDFNAWRTIVQRRSCRKFTGGPMTLEQVRECLAFAFRKEGAPWCLAPGGLDFHVVALAVDGLEAGVYRLDPATLSLSAARLGNFRSEILFLCLGQDLAAECAFALIHTSDLAALVEAYGDRGYRYACLDAGQIGERLNLWAMHLGLGSSGIGGYYDDQGNKLLDLPLSHGILYISLVGVPGE